jgi:hypothetical protein
VHGLWTVRAAGAGPAAHDAFLLISARYVKTDKAGGAQQEVRQTRVLATHRELEEVSSRWVSWGSWQPPYTASVKAHAHMSSQGVQCCDGYKCTRYDAVLEVFTAYCSSTAECFVHTACF